METFSQGSLHHLKNAETLGVQTLRHRGRAFFIVWTERDQERFFLHGDEDLVPVMFSSLDAVNSVIQITRPDLIIPVILEEEGATLSQNFKTTANEQPVSMLV